MRTPAGKECRFFYGDYFRGRNIEECRLLKDTSPPLPWKPALCSTCPVPDFLLANACPNLVFQPTLGRPFPFLKQEVQITTYCTKTQRTGFDAHIGCGECHALPAEFLTGNLPPGETS